MNYDVKSEKIIWSTFHSTKEINRNATNLFLFDVNDHFSKIEHTYSKYISSAELVKASRYVKIEDKKRYIVGKYFTRFIFSEFTMLPPPSIIFDTGIYGKPLHRHLKFNISHSGNFVVIITDTKDVGIDIEEINKNIDHQQLMPEIFTRMEMDFINSDKKLSLARFYMLWCRKEALLKASGEGLVNNLTKINVLEKNAYRAGFKYTLLNFEMGTEYAMSIAMQRKNSIKFWKF